MLFELDSFDLECNKNCTLTIDNSLNKKIREFLNNIIESLTGNNVQNGAVVIIDPRTSELISLVGSTNPRSNSLGSKINMTTRPRAIGSTIKPFIYGLAFENGLRPYTLVDDREYRYDIASGYAFYPKNYDYQYRGVVDLQYSLSNSLNVPTVKVLEYIGTRQFSDFILSDLEYKPAQPLDNYSLGIALGQLEMDPLSLAYYFSALANKGKLNPLQICKKNCKQNLNNNLQLDKQILPTEYVELINSILTDKSTRIDQFGMNNNLESYFGEFAVKTGTSRDYHDSWIVGYSPEIVVLAWLGNADEKPMKDISGSSGAGNLWNKIIHLLKAMNKIKGTSFEYRDIYEYKINHTLKYGLKNDDIKKYINVLLDQDTSLITDPHDGDRFQYNEGIKIPFSSKINSEWKVNDEYIGDGKEVIFKPTEKGIYKIEAVGKDIIETVNIYVD